MGKVLAIQELLCLEVCCRNENIAMYVWACLRDRTRNEDYLGQGRVVSVEEKMGSKLDGSGVFGDI